jgi:phage repressor protein C with HTH and peptisase S24 domain
LNDYADLKNSEEKTETSEILPTSRGRVGNFKNRLKEVIGGEAVHAFGQKCGISKATLYNYLDGKSYPTLDRLQAIADASGRDLWFFLSDGDTGQAEEKISPYGISEDFALVPRYNVQASMGGGADIQSEQVVDHLAFKRSWLKDMDLQADSLALITAEGDSMIPTIKDGCLMLVDTRKHTTIKDGIYVLRWDGALMAKRLQKLLDGAILVKSDNSIYQEIKAEKDQIELLNIVGKVVWTGSTV